VGAGIKPANLVTLVGAVGYSTPHLEEVVNIEQRDVLRIIHLSLGVGGHRQQVFSGPIFSF
jgi:hypothetical protein